MKVVVAGGGSGGHVFPGMAVIEELKAMGNEVETLFIGTEQGIESVVVPKEGYEIKFIRAEGFVGRGLLGKLRAVLRAVGALFASRKILRAADPDVVLGTGGYVSMGPVAMARTMSIPTLLLEPNLSPGMANRLLGRFADAVALTYHEGLSHFTRGRAYLTGSPVRPNIFTADRAVSLKLFRLKEGLFTVFISGGSQGARSINNAFIGALNHLIDLKDEIQFLHQCGQSDYEGVRKALRRLGFAGMAVPFVHQMAEAYATADLLVSRAGATTLAEITALGKPSILVPYPHASGHQEQNARKLMEGRAAMVIQEHELTGQRLADAIRELYTKEGLRAEMQSRSKAIGKPDAAKRVAGIVLSLANTYAEKRKRGRRNV